MRGAGPPFGAARGQMAVRLMVKRVTVPEAGISAMLWSEGRDARLLEWRAFHGEAALGVWVAGILGKYGREAVKLDWTDELKTDERLGPLLSKLFGLSGT